MWVLILLYYRGVLTRIASTGISAGTTSICYPFASLTGILIFQPHSTANFSMSHRAPIAAFNDVSGVVQRCFISVLLYSCNINVHVFVFSPALRFCTSHLNAPGPTLPVV
jgi:hypothetical protein